MICIGAYNTTYSHSSTPKYCSPCWTRNDLCVRNEFPDLLCLIHQLDSIDIWDLSQINSSHLQHPAKTGFDRPWQIRFLTERWWWHTWVKLAYAVRPSRLILVAENIVFKCLFPAWPCWVSHSPYLSSLVHCSLSPSQFEIRRRTRLYYWSASHEMKTTWEEDAPVQNQF